MNGRGIAWTMLSPTNDEIMMIRVAIHDRLKISIMTASDLKLAKVSIQVLMGSHASPIFLSGVSLFFAKRRYVLTSVKFFCNI
jgi:hypothetical protein